MFSSSSATTELKRAQRRQVFPTQHFGAIVRDTCTVARDKIVREVHNQLTFTIGAE
jgi:hypothetical protein